MNSFSWISTPRIVERLWWISRVRKSWFGQFFPVFSSLLWKTGLPYHVLLSVSTLTPPPPPPRLVFELFSYLSDVQLHSVLWTHSCSTPGVHEICTLPFPLQRFSGFKSPPDQAVPIPPTLQWWGLALSSHPLWPPPLLGSCLPWGWRNDLCEGRGLPLNLQPLVDPPVGQKPSAPWIPLATLHTLAPANPKPWAWQKWAGAIEAQSPSLTPGQIWGWRGLPHFTED